MNPEEYAIMYGVEEHHWWYQGMEHISRAILQRIYPSRKPLKVLDAGCGTGLAAAGFLAEYGQVTACDLSRLALDFSKKRRVQRLARASIDALPFRTAAFDLVTSFDVASDGSIADDLAVFREFHRVLVPGGRLLIRLPALKWLRGAHDAAVHTARRYALRQLTDKLSAGGFSIQLAAYANCLLLPLVLIKRWSEFIFRSRSRASDLKLDPGRLNGLLRLVLSSEAPLVLHSLLPAGVSVFAVGIKA